MQQMRGSDLPLFAKQRPSIQSSLDQETPMPLDIRGQLTDRQEIRAGFIGCGSHAFRNVYPTFQFAPVKLVATCDLQQDKAEAYARQFGAERSYNDHRKMIEAETLDAVFIVTNYDEKGRPRYVNLAGDALRAGLHVWM